MKSFAPVLSSLLLATSLVSPALAAENHAPAKPDLAKGEAISTNVCAACHVADATRGAPANPILKGQHPEYLAKQLHDFKEDKRKNAVMKGFASALSEDDIRNVSAFYASKAPSNGTAKSKATIALGEKIYRGGIADRSVPACAGCHNPTGAGNPSQFPRLGGQHADYTEAQLIAFRNGTRKNSAVMVGVVAKMNDREIKAVSDYIAGLR
jgi:cytochrome c553